MPMKYPATQPSTAALPAYPMYLRAMAPLE